MYTDHLSGLCACHCTICASTYGCVFWHLAAETQGQQDFFNMKLVQRFYILYQLPVSLVAFHSCFKCMQSHSRTTVSWWLFWQLTDCVSLIICTVHGSRTVWGPCSLCGRGCVGWAPSASEEQFTGYLICDHQQQAHNEHFRVYSTLVRKARTVTDRQACQQP